MLYNYFRVVAQLLHRRVIVCFLYAFKSTFKNTVTINSFAEAELISQGQYTFLATSADKQTSNYDTKLSNHHSSLSTLRSKRLSHSKMKW